MRAPQASRRRALFLTLIAACAALGAACGDGDKGGAAPAGGAGGGAKPAAPALDPARAAKLIALENRGIAFLERYDYAQALPPLRGAHEIAPTWIPGRLHLALALIHSTRGDGGEAKALLDGILAEDPAQPHAAFLAAWLSERSGETDVAAKLYETAYRATAKDPVVGAKYGILLAGMDGREREALAILKEVHASQPTLTAAVNQLMLLSRQLGDEAASEGYLAELKALKAQVRPEIDGSKVGQEIREAYGNMGRYSMAMHDFGTPLTPADEQRPAVEVVVEELPWKLAAASAGAGPVPTAAAFDADHDGDPDIVADLGTPSQGAPEGGVLLVNDGGKLAGRAPVAGDLGRQPWLPLVAFAVGDFDIDPSLSAATSGAGAEGMRPGRRARPDLVVSGGGSFLVMLGKEGAFEPAAGAPAPFADGSGAAVRWMGSFDADQDGDLDLLVSTTKGLRLYANSGAAKFTDVTETSGLNPQGADGGACGAAAVIDFDGDYDLDLVVSRPGAAPAIFANDRLMKFRAAALPAGLDARSGAAPHGVVAGDFDADGHEDVILAGESGATLLRGDGRGFVPQALAGAPGGPVALVDTRLSGRRDLVFADGSILEATGEKGRPFATTPTGLPRGKLSNLAQLVVADFDGDGAEDVLRLEWGKPAQRLTFRTPSRGNSVVLDIEGVIRNDVQAGWSNIEGRGALVEVKAGASWQRIRAGNPQGAGAATGNRLVFGIGGAKQADFVRVVWPDAVQQAVLDVPSGAPQVLLEEQRRPDSCPLLFAWDGEKWDFVTDFLGVGGVGFLVAPGVYGAPDPTESVKVERRHVVPQKDGTLVFKLLEAMEEVCYIDHCDLEVIDHPAGTTVYPDERFAGEKPFPDGRTLTYDREILPVAAKDGAGNDVLERIATVDRRYSESPTLHPRLLGATGEQVLDLDFGDRLAGIAKGDGVALFANGWIEYGYTRTSVAAAGEGFAYLTPTLEAFDSKTGKWTTLVANVGYPAGFPRVMTYDLTGLVSRETPRLRIRTNFEVYWDRVWLGRLAPASKTTRAIVPAAAADLRWVGYPREYSPDGRAPRIYDYHTMDPSMPWKTVEGDYTRFGDVAELLTTADDQYVIFGKGEEIEVRFDTRKLPAPAAGMERSYVLRFTGWCKGQELYTAHGWTVEPLPFLGMSHYPYRDDERFPDDAAHRAWRERWNTRRVRAVR